MSTKLDAASFNRAELDEARLREAVLVDTDLSRACLRGTDVTGADFDRVHLYGTDLSGVTGWSAEQIEQAFCWSTSTRWPDGFTPSTPTRICRREQLEHSKEF